MGRTAVLGMLCILATLGLSACGQGNLKTIEFNSPIEIQSNPDKESAILYGDFVEPDSAAATSVVRLRISGEKGSYLCSGSVLNDEWILTAAHCIDGDVKGVTVEFYRSNVSRDLRIAYQWDSLWKKTNSTSSAFDIALIRFIGGIPSDFRAARFFENDHNLSTVTIAGLGTDEFAKTTYLKQIDHTIARRDQGILIGRHQLGSICFGDSGGPWYLESKGQMYLVGVSSRVETTKLGQCRAGNYGIATDLYQDAVREFVLKVTGIRY